MYRCDVSLTKDQVDVLKYSSIQNMLDNIRKMDASLVTHLKSGNYDLSKDKGFTKAYLNLFEYKNELEYFNEVSKDLDNY